MDTPSSIPDLVTLQEYLIIFDSVPAWIFYKNKDNIFVRVNKAFCDAMEKSKEELEGKSLFDIYPHDQAQKFWDDDLEVIKSGVSKKSIVEKIDTPKGLRWVETNKIPYKDAHGDIIGVIGFTVDITDRIRAEEIKKNSQIMLQKIIDVLPIRIFWKDINLCYLGCNIAFAKDAGKSTPEEIIGKDDFQMGWKDQAEMYRKDDMEVINSKTPIINHIENQTTPEGNTIWLNTNKLPLMGDNGEVRGVLGTYMDITDKKIADDNLKKALEESKEINELMIGRELKMIEMKKKIEELETLLK